jgi:hypothetical protein
LDSGWRDPNWGLPGCGKGLGGFLDDGNLENFVKLCYSSARVSVPGIW